MNSPTGIAPVLQVHPSRRCNLACAHCYSSSSPQIRAVLAADALAACLEDAAELGYRQLAVSGGEPLLYDGLGELLRRARALGMQTSVTSNGMLATAARWEPLAGSIDVAAISIDGTEAEHDAIRGRQGAFAKAVSHLPVIRRSGVAFGFIFTLTQHNVASLESVVRLAAEHGARSVQVHPLTIHGRAVAEMTGARPDGVELLCALFEAMRLGRALGVAVHVDALTTAQLRAYRGALVPAVPVRTVVDAAPVMVVEASGRAVPLTHELAPRLALGSVVEQRLGALARAWLDSGKADELVQACARTWDELTRTGANPAVYWYDEVAARTWRGTAKLRAAAG